MYVIIIILNIILYIIKYSIINLIKIYIVLLYSEILDLRDFKVIRYTHRPRSGKSPTYLTW